MTAATFCACFLLDKILTFCLSAVYRSINHGGEPDDGDGDDDNEAAANNGDAPGAPRQERDALQEDLLVNNGDGVEGGVDVPERTWCFDMVRLRQNGNYDFFCMQNVKKGQIWMVAISVILLICLVLYALV